MSTFSVPVCCIESIENHPNADRLSVVKLEGMGFTCITNKKEDGTPRYVVGDLVVYIPSASILPEWLLKSMDFWNAETGKGGLSGSNGDRVKPMKLRGIFSEGVLYPLYKDHGWWVIDTETAQGNCVAHAGDAYRPPDSISNLDMADVMGITKWSPPIPVGMAGEVANVQEAVTNYDFERYESATDIFTSDDIVTAVEKAHGTCCILNFIPGLNNPEMFGNLGCITVGSKGLNKQGLVFKNNDNNSGNVYVQTLRKLLEAGFENNLAVALDMTAGDDWSSNDDFIGLTTIFGEIFGGNIQDLKYGLTSPTFRVFDVKIDGEWLDRDYAEIFCKRAGLEMLPVLYSGPFDLDAIVAVRDGKTMIGGDNVREGVVVTSTDMSYHPKHGRRIAKFISPDYLTRKAPKGAEATEFQ